MFRVLTGSEFQAAGPVTANELSAKRVLVHRTTKLPRVDDRRRLPLNYLLLTANIGQMRRRCAVKYIKHEDAQLVRYASGNRQPV